MRILRHNRIAWPGRFTVALVMLAASLLALTRIEPVCTVSASDVPSDWCYRTQVFVTNTVGGAHGDLTDFPVRFVIDSSNLIATARMDARAFDLYPYVGSFSTEAELILQDLDGDDSAWWAIIPTLPDGGTATLTMLTGTSDRQRDQGLFFGPSGTGEMTVADDADFDLTDDISVRVKLEMNDLTEFGQDATLFSRWAGNQGYRLLLFNNANALEVRTQIDATQLDTAWVTAWTGEPTWLELRYVDPRLSLFANGVEVDFVVTGGGVIATAAVGPTVGTDLDESIIRGIEVIDLSGPSVVARWGFDPRAGPSPADTLTEASAVDPDYTSTVPEYSGNGHTGTWAITADQSDIAITVGPTAPTSATPLLSVIGTPIDAVGSPFITAMFPGVSENEDSPLWDVFDAAMTGSLIPRTMFWAMLLIMGGLALGGAILAGTKSMPIAIAAGGAPLGYGVINGYVEPWLLLLWILAAMVLWGAGRWGSEAT